MVVYIVISTILLLGTIKSALPMRKWWVKGFNALRLHFAVLILLTIIAGFVCFPSGKGTIMLFQLLLFSGLLYHLSKIYHFTPVSRVEVPSCKPDDYPSIRFFAANVRMSNDHYDRLVAVVEKHQPDVVLLTETDQQWVDGVKSLEKHYEYTLLQPQDNTYGMALYSKIPLKNAKVNFLVEDDIPSFHVNIQAPFGREIQFIGLHPRPPAPWTKEENKDLEMVVAAGITNYNLLPTVVSGDLNDVGWSKITWQFKRLSSMRDPRVGRGFFNTYNALLPFFRMPIDHFFVSKHFRLIHIKRLEKFGSDHFPVLLEVGFCGNG